MKNETMKIGTVKKTVFAEPSLRLVPLAKPDILTTSSDTEMSEVVDEDE